MILDWLFTFKSQALRKLSGSFLCGGFVGLTAGHQTGVKFPWGTPAHLFPPHWLPPLPSLEHSFSSAWESTFSPVLWVLTQLSLYQRVLLKDVTAGKVPRSVY